MIITLGISTIRIEVVTIVMIKATTTARTDAIVTVMIVIKLMYVTITIPIIMTVLVSNHQLVPKFLQDTVPMPPKKFLLKEERQSTLQKRKILVGENHQMQTNEAGEKSPL